MVMDKGLSINQVKDFLSVAGPHVDIVKLGFGTSFVTPNLKEKLAVYREANMPVYFGGTLFEAFLIRNQFDDYVEYVKNMELAILKCRMVPLPFLMPRNADILKS